MQYQVRVQFPFYIGLSSSFLFSFFPLFFLLDLTQGLTDARWTHYHRPGAPALLRSYCPLTALCDFWGCYSHGTIQTSCVRILFTHLNSPWNLRWLPAWSYTRIIKVRVWVLEVLARQALPSSSVILPVKRVIDWYRKLEERRFFHCGHSGNRQRV